MTLPANISGLEWSPTGTHLLCCRHSTLSSAKSSVVGKTPPLTAWVHVFAAADSQQGNAATTAEWEARIEEGMAGLVRCRWSPDGAHILCWSEFQVCSTSWCWEC
jgi:hypothetical protein